jgi:hypothetical protein
VRYVDFMDNFLAPTETFHTAASLSEPQIAKAAVSAASFAVVRAKPLSPIEAVPGLLLGASGWAKAWSSAGTVALAQTGEEQAGQQRGHPFNNS